MTRKSFFLLVALSLLLVAVPVHTQAGSLTGEIVCLDPGHGGSDPDALYDPGAVYDDGTIYLEEADINLDVSYALQALLKGDGATVVMTRTDDSYRSNRDRYTYCNEQQATLLVSVHTNGSTDSSMDGSMALYFHTDDQVLARAIQDVMYPHLREEAPVPDQFRDFGLSKFASGVLLKSDMPAAMMEPLFMSHPAEAELLAQPIHDDAGAISTGCAELACRRGQIAQAIYEGILNYVTPGEVNNPPTAGFSFTTSDLTASLTDTSTDSDGTITAWSWEFGDGATSTAQNPSHTYASDGTYTVSLTVTDDDGATDTTSQSVTVSSGGGGISLTATGYKYRGLQKADLAWSGAASTDVDVFRDGAMIATTANDGVYTDNIDQRGGGSYTYQVCEAGTTTCSNETTVTY